MPHNPMRVVTVPIQSHSPGCEKVCCAGYIRVEAVLNPLRNDPAFMNTEINPIFSADNFFHDPEIFRPALMQALRLTTKLIDATLPFFHTILWGKTVVLQEETADLRKRIQFVDEGTELTEHSRRLTQADLKRFAGRIVFKFDDESGCSGCELEIDPKTGKDRAVISLNRAVYDETLNAYWNGTDAAHDAWIQTRVAVTLGHELVHAIMSLTHGNNIEAYFGDSQVAEEGFEWEKRTFGGTFYLEDKKSCYYQIHTTPSELKGTLVLEDWPCLKEVETYEREGWAIGVRGDVPKVNIRWNVSISHFLNLLQESWWETEYARRGPAALRPPKVTGARYMTKGAALVPYYIEDDEEGLADTVPRGYEALQQGLVVPADGPADL
ncbi:hypothetical protein LTR85_004714 [Meristemomyces frigidus]|nr:hypothetical protein LTR85_004714 [Meristemomyces frigidus]